MEIYFELIQKTKDNKELSQVDINRKILELLDQCFRVLDGQNEEIKKLRKDFIKHDHLNGKIVSYLN